MAGKGIAGVYSLMRKRGKYGYEHLQISGLCKDG